LPKVQASADFEQRLQRRLAGNVESPATGGWLGKFLAPRRIPVFAYSLATLVLVGVVSYFAFFRSGIVPRGEQPMILETEKKISASGSTAGQPAAEGEPVNQLNKSDGAKRPTPAGKPMNGPPNVKSEARQKGQEELRNESPVSNLSRDEELTRPVETGAAQEKDMKSEDKQVAAPASGQYRGGRTDDLKSKDTMDKERERMENRKTEQVAPSPQEAARKLYAPALQNASKSIEYKLQTQQMSAAAQFDSLAQKDSLKADSLRRMQKQQQMQQQRGKTKRPGGKD
jgi:hypothetical protein